MSAVRTSVVLLGAWLVRGFATSPESQPKKFLNAYVQVFGGWGLKNISKYARVIVGLIFGFSEFKKHKWCGLWGVADSLNGILGARVRERRAK